LIVEETEGTHSDLSCLLKPAEDLNLTTSHRFIINTATELFKINCSIQTLTGFSIYIIIDRRASKLIGAKWIRCWKQQKFQGRNKIMCCAIRGSQQTTERQTERQTCSQQRTYVINSTLELTGLLTILYVGH